MRRGGYLRYLLQQFHVLGALAEFKVAHKRAERVSAEYAELFFVNFLEHRALVEFRRALQIAKQILLRAVEDLNPEVHAGLGLGDQVLQPSPGGFELLERLVVEYF